MDFKYFIIYEQDKEEQEVEEDCDEPAKGQLMLKCPFVALNLPKNQRKFSRIFALAFKKRPNQKNKVTLYL